MKKLKVKCLIEHPFYDEYESSYSYRRVEIHIPYYDFVGAVDIQHYEYLKANRYLDEYITRALLSTLSNQIELEIEDQVTNSNNKINPALMSNIKISKEEI